MVAAVADVDGNPTCTERTLLPAAMETEVLNFFLTIAKFCNLQEDDDSLPNCVWKTLWPVFPSL